MGIQLTRKIAITKADVRTRSVYLARLTKPSFFDVSAFFFQLEVFAAIGNKCEGKDAKDLKRRYYFHNRLVPIKNKEENKICGLQLHWIVIPETHIIE